MQTFQGVFERAVLNYGVENILRMAAPRPSTWTKKCSWIDEVKIRESKVLHRSGNKSDRLFKTRFYEHNTEFNQRDREAISAQALKSGRAVALWMVQEDSLYVIAKNPARDDYDYSEDYHLNRGLGG